jgi:starch synthase
MTVLEGGASRLGPEGPVGRPPGLLLASRGDALTPYLFEVLGRRFPIGGRIEPELNRSQRLSVAAGTFRPSRSRWVEQFYKSNRGYRMRSANAARARVRLGHPHDPVFQVHALFEVRGASSLLYVDCTHEQAATYWPAWNPLRGRALARWFAQERRAYAAAGHIFAFSRATHDSLVNSYGIGADRVSVVGAGINLDRMPAERVDEGPAPAPVILFVGNDFTRKGGHTLLEAFARVRREIPGARLQLVGTDPPIRSRPGVEVLGRIHDRACLTRLYEQATVFCLPSIFDPFPLVLLEAMAHGLPVVSTSSVGIPDVVIDGEHGLLVPSVDPGALAAALLALLTDPLRAHRLGAAGRARVADAFSWEHVVDRMTPALARALAC